MVLAEVSTVVVVVGEIGVTSGEPLHTTSMTSNSKSNVRRRLKKNSNGLKLIIILLLKLILVPIHLFFVRLVCILYLLIIPSIIKQIYSIFRKV